MLLLAGLGLDLGQYFWSCFRHCHRRRLLHRFLCHFSAEQITKHAKQASSSNPISAILTTSENSVERPSTSSPASMPAACHGQWRGQWRRHSRGNDAVNATAMNVEWMRIVWHYSFRSDYSTFQGLGFAWLALVYFTVKRFRLWAEYRTVDYN